MTAFGVRSGTYSNGAAGCDNTQRPLAHSLDQTEEGLPWRLPKFRRTANPGAEIPISTRNALASRLSPKASLYFRGPGPQRHAAPSIACWRVTSRFTPPARSLTRLVCASTAAPTLGPRTTYCRSVGRGTSSEHGWRPSRRAVSATRPSASMAGSQSASDARSLTDTSGRSTRACSRCSTAGSSARLINDWGAGEGGGVVTVNHQQFGTVCEVCFARLTPERCAADRDRQRWDVCSGVCAEQAGITEARREPTCSVAYPDPFEGQLTCLRELGHRGEHEDDRGHWWLADDQLRTW
jgi:hypothetical protein